MLEFFLQWIESFLPEGFHMTDMLIPLAVLALSVVAIAAFIRMIADKASGYTHALASAMALLFVYVFLMLVHTENSPDFIKNALDILPLIEYDNGVVTLFQFTKENFRAFFNELLYAFILSFILIGLDDLIPDSKNEGAWILIQMFITAVSVFLYWGVTEAIESLWPGVLSGYAPLILGCILLFMVALGLAKLIFSLLVVAVNPLLMAVGTFFGTSPVGKALGKAALCALILCAFAAILGQLGLDAIVLEDLSLLICFMPLAVTLLLWIVIGYLF